MMIGVIFLLLLASCAPSVQGKCNPDGTAEAVLNRGWFTEQEIKGVRVSCSPKTGLVFGVDDSSARTDSAALSAITEAAVRGAVQGAKPGP